MQSALNQTTFTAYDHIHADHINEFGGTDREETWCAAVEIPAMMVNVSWRNPDPRAPQRWTQIENLVINGRVKITATSGSTHEGTTQERYTPSGGGHPFYTMTTQATINYFDTPSRLASQSGQGQDGDVTLDESLIVFDTALPDEGILASCTVEISEWSEGDDVGAHQVEPSLGRGDGTVFDLCWAKLDIELYLAHTLLELSLIHI